MQDKQSDDLLIHGTEVDKIDHHESKNEKIRRPNIDLSSKYSM